MTIHKPERRFAWHHWGVIVAVLALVILIYATGYFGLKPR
jgi:hypothetical protein